MFSELKYFKHIIKITLLTNFFKFQVHSNQKLSGRNTQTIHFLIFLLKDRFEPTL